MDDKEREQWMNLRKAYDALVLRHNELEVEYETLSDACLDLHKENRRLWEVANAAGYVVQLAIVRKSPPFDQAYLAALNRLAQLVPGTRNFEQNPLT